jgi:short-subunit dehydrogenase involved in D-alanine esterification of teichoic acids
LQTIWITGGSSGIGFATAKEFIKNDWQVVISSSNKIKLESAKKKIRTK